MDYYMFLIITLFITIGSQIYLNSTYKRCEKIASNKGMKGADVARKILDKNDLKSIKLEENDGFLSDHYDPKKKIVSLSDSIYGEASIASVSVAAHECGHALQDKDGYAFLRFRSMIFPVVNIASKAGYVAILIGFIAGAIHFILLGIICEAVILFFQLITLPVEFNASKRGLKQLVDLEIVDKSELSNCRKMLVAAALTYVASVATSALEILRLVMILRRRD